MSDLFQQPSDESPDMEDSELDSDASDQQGGRRTGRKPPYPWNENRHPCHTLPHPLLPHPQPAFFNA